MSEASAFDAEVQFTEDKPWRNEELRSTEEGLPRLKEERLERAARSYKAATEQVEWA